MAALVDPSLAVVAVVEQAMPVAVAVVAVEQAMPAVVAVAVEQAMPAVVAAAVVAVAALQAEDFEFLL